MSALNSGRYLLNAIFHYKPKKIFCWAKLLARCARKSVSKSALCLYGAIKWWAFWFLRNDNARIFCKITLHCHIQIYESKLSPQTAFHPEWLLGRWNPKFLSEQKNLQGFDSWFDLAVLTRPSRRLTPHKTWTETECKWFKPTRFMTREGVFYISSNQFEQKEIRVCYVASQVAWFKNSPLRIST